MWRKLNGTVFWKLAVVSDTALNCLLGLMFAAMPMLVLLDRNGLSPTDILDLIPHAPGLLPGMRAVWLLAPAVFAVLVIWLLARRRRARRGDGNGPQPSGGSDLMFSNE